MIEDSKMPLYQGEHQDYPLSDGQQAIWILHRLDPNHTGHNTGAVARINVGPSASAVKKTFDRLVKRHSALRTTFVEVDEQPMQRVWSQGEAWFEQVSAEHLDQTDFLRLFEAAAEQPFNLERGPLLRVLLYCGPDQQWYLQVCMHHIITDEWSYALMLYEADQIYRNETGRLELNLKPLKISYGEWAAQENDRLNGVQGDELRRYWRERLEGDLQPPALPFARPAARQNANLAGYMLLELDAQTQQALAAFSHEIETPLYVTLLAVFMILLSRYMHTEDVAAGFLSANRRRETARLIGYFLNPFLFRTRVDGRQSFAEYVKTVNASLQSDLAHASYPFLRVAQELPTDPSQAGRSPWLRTVFSWQKTTPIVDNREVGDFAVNAEGASVRGGGLELAQVHLRRQNSPFEMTLLAANTHNGPALACEYNLDIYPQEAVAALLEHFLNVLKGGLAAPHRPLSAIPTLSAEEWQRTLEAWNDTRNENLGETTVLQLIEAQARSRPEATALTFGDQQLTYAELMRRSAVLAARLKQAGIAHGTIAALCMHRSTEMVIAALAVMQAGAAYLPLDPSHPAERLQFILDDSAAKAVLTNTDLPWLETQARISSPGPSVIHVQAQPDSASPALSSDDQPKPSDPAYVIYTSGSTGTPKGVVIEHRALANLLAAMQAELGLGAADVMPVVMALSFDGAVMEMLLPLSAGARLVLFDHHTVNDPRRLAQALDETGVTVMLSTPSAWRSLLESGWAGRRRLKALSGGEALAPETAAALVERTAEVWNLYGPTETTVLSTLWRVQPESERILIGRPIANTQVYVLDHHRQPVPAGVSGEIYIGGSGLAAGYLNRPELTAQSFVPNPFRKDAGGRLYRTGDLGRFLPTGELEYLGRLDDQVKIHGYRIEPAEIEAVLARHPLVAAAAVIPFEEPGGDRALAAFVAWRGDSRDETERLAELRRFLQTALPIFMIPGRFIFLDALPITPNGKLDRKALAALNPEAARQAHAGSPRNPIEAALVEIWQKTLGLQYVGIYDNFFEIGGHSLTATQIGSRIDRQFGTALALTLIFEQPTIAALARKIQAELAGGKFAPPGPILPTPRSGPMPVSFSQERMWFIQQMDPHNSAYNVPAAVRLIGKLDIPLVKDCLSALIRRHEVLRSTIYNTPDGPVLMITPEQEPEFEVIDLRLIPADEREAHLFGLLAAEAGQPFDLARGPLLRLFVYLLADAEAVILVNMHHVATDAWSIGVMIRELDMLYRAGMEGRSAELPPLRIQYADFARWQREWFSGEIAEAQLAYWRKQLEGLGPLALPTTRPRPPLQTYGGEMVSARLTPRLVEAVRQAAHDEHLTPFMVYEAGFSALLQRYTGQDDLSVGMPIANRHWLENEDLVGTFVNTLVLRSDLSGDPTFRELLARTRNTALQAFAHQDYPFERLVADLQVQRDLSISPLFQVMFNYTDTRMPDTAAAGLQWAPVVFDRCAAQFDLTVTVSKVNDEHILTAEYNVDLFERRLMQALLDHYVRLLENGLVDPETRLSQLEMLGPEEQQRLLKQWNDTAVLFADMRPLQALFEQQARRTPNQTAVVWKDQRLSYAELNRGANRLARYLRKAGVGADTCVGVFMERSPEMIVALLAVLKSGAAYVPMDPKYPDKRLAYMLEDSQAVALLTHGAAAERLRPGAARLIRVDAESSRIASESDADLDLVVEMDSIAYIIYTSGSTGEPKGVQGLQRGIVNRLHWMWEKFPFEPGEICCQKTALSFVDSIWEIFGPLLRGVPLVILSDETITDPGLLVEALGEHAVTRLVLVPSLLRVILENEADLDRRLRHLKLWTTSGEKIPAKLSRLFFDRLPGRTLLNLYGCSEATADSTYHIVDPNAQEAGVPIGRPIANTCIYILDDRQRPVPVGVPGEIYIGGDGLGRGYHRRPELTAEKFVTLQIGRQNPKRLYRSGDLGRYRLDGEIDYLGRIGSQVKVRGHRIEIGEIEAVLARHATVKQTLVRAIDAGGAQQLIAYIQPGDELAVSEVDVAELRRFAAEFLPDYMLPARWAVIDRFPTLPNGKIDLAALPLPEALPATIGPYREEAPGWIEQRLSRLWEQTLGVKPQGIDDNFFELGGHSLLVISLVQAIETEFGLRLPVVSIFQAATIRDQAALIAANQTILTLSPLVPIQRGAEKRPFICIHGFGGGVTDYHDLARALGPQRPFYGLQARGLEGSEAPHRSIEEMGEYYLKWVRTIQPHGPYALGGYCFGGLVAYEMARQLEAAGEQADLIAVFEGYAPLPSRRTLIFTPKHALNFIQNLFFWLQDFSGLVLSERVARLKFSLRMAFTRLTPGRRGNEFDLRAVMQNIDRIPERYQEIMNIQLRAQLDYKPEPIRGKVTLFRVKALSLARSFDPLMGWGGLARGGVESRLIDGSHGNIVFKPYVESLGRELKDALEKAEAGAASDQAG